MPHSSGGGSCSSGSHGGSSSHSSGGGSRSSGGSGGTAYRTYNKPHKGCHGFIHYDKDNQAHIIYCNYDPSVKPKRNGFMGIIGGIMIIIPIITMALPILLGSFYIFKPVEKTYANAGNIVISDNLGIVEDYVATEQALSEFYEKTGVTPAIVTISDNEWVDNYDSLEVYAYSYYCELFSDECHWLFVYSEPESGFNNWKWEGMLGNDVGCAITTETERFVTAELQKNLYRGMSFDKALSETLKTTLDDGITYFSVSFYPLLLGLCLFFLLALMFYCAVFGESIGRKYYADAVPVDSKVTIVKCDYCGGSYGSNVTLGCPHCGATVNTSDRN